MSPALLACLFPAILIGLSYGVGFMVGRRRLRFHNPIEIRRADDLIETDDNGPEPLPVVNSRARALIKR